MDCGHYEQLIGRMPDEELTGEELKSLYEHLRACPECRRLHAAVRELSRELREEAAEAPESLLPNVMAAVQAAGPHKRQKKKPVWAGWVVTAACAALVIGVGAPLLSPKGSADLAESEAYMAPAAAEAAPAEAQALPEEAPLPEPAEEAAEEAAKEAVFDSAVTYSTAADEPAEEAAAAEPAAPAAEAPEEELAAGTAGAGAWDGEAHRESELFATAVPAAEAEDTAVPVRDAQGGLLGHIRDMDALLALCSQEGEPLALTEFECGYNIEYDGLVYQFLVYDGRLWWRSDGEGLLLPANGSEETLLYLIQ